MIDYSKNSGFPEDWKYASETFHEWWNPDKFDWAWSYSWHLCRTCSDKIEIWWDPEKFNWLQSWYLCRWCLDKIEIWWDADKFNWSQSDYLKKYCSEYEHIWAADYIIQTV